VKGNSRYPEPFRELLAGVKQQGNGIELALELPSEIYSRTGRKPIVIRAGYRYDWPVSGLKKSGLLILRLFWRRFFCRISHSIREDLSVSEWVYSERNKKEWYRGTTFRLFSRRGGRFFII